MKLTVISPRGVEFENDSTEALTIPTAMGEITVLNHHRPLITLLEKGTAVVTFGGGEKRYFDVSAGFLEVTERNELKVLVQ